MSVQSNISEALGLGASATTDADYGQQGALRDILAQTSGSAANADKAIALANQLVPQAEEADPWAAAFKFFAEMGKQASKPGATVLGSAVSSMSVPFDYLQAKKAERNQTEQARMKTALSLGPSLKGPAVTKATYGKPDFYMVSRLVDGQLTEAVQTPLTPRDFNELRGKIADGSVVISEVPKAAKTGTVNYEKYIDPSITDDPATPLIDERITRLSDAQFDARMAEGKPVYPLKEADSALIAPVDTSLGNAKKTVIYGNGTTLTTYNSGTVLRTGGSNEPVLEADFEKVMNEAREAGVTDTIRGSAAAEAGKSAVQVGTAAFETMGKLVSEMEILERAKTLVLPDGGANTGWLAANLPSVFASSIELDNLQSKLGLAVVGQNTFGALSKGELDLALATALPTTMQEAELADWIDRKLAAQRKLIRYYSEAASYLTDPLNDGGIAAWVDIKREEFEAEEGAKAIKSANVITGMPRSEFDLITPEQTGLYTKAELKAYIARKMKIQKAEKGTSD